jgi:hypothetical protein
MQVVAIRMRRARTVLAAVVAAALCTLLLFAVIGSSTAQARKHHRGNGHALRHNHKGKKHHGRAAATPGETTSESSGESSTESETGQPGEPAGGHQDSGSNVDHQATGVE